MFGIGAQTGQLAGNLGAQIGNLGGAQQGLMGTDIARLYGAGGQQQNLAQQGLDLAYGNFVGGYNLPLQSIGQIGQLAAGFAPSLGGTTIQQTSQSNPSNPLMQAAGTALAAYGAMQGQPQSCLLYTSDAADE